MKRFLFILALTVLANAAEYYVDDAVSGTSGSGTSGSPWGFTNGLTHLSPGDTMFAQAGTYYGNFQITNRGSSGSPIIIQGLPGAILDAATYHVTSWTRATEFARPVYKLTSPPFEIGGVIVDGHNLDGIWKSLIASDYTIINRPNPYGITHSSFDNNKTTNNFWAGIAGMWYHTNAPSGSLYIRFAAGEDPATHDIWLSRLDGYFGTSPSNDRSPYGATVLFNGAQHLTFRGFEVRGGRNGIALQNISTEGAHHLTIESNYVHHGIDMIAFAPNDSAPTDYDGLISVSNNVVQGNTISEDRYLDNYGAWTYTDTNTWALFNAYAFNKERYGRTVEGMAVMLSYGWQNQVNNNWITNVNGGICTPLETDSSGPKSDSITITNNWIAETSAAAIYLQPGASDTYAFDNFITNAHYPFRFQDVGLPVPGSYTRDVWAAFNRAANPVGRGDGVYVHAGSSPSTSPVRVWFYNNSFSGCARGVHISATMATYGLPYWRIIGDVFSTSLGIVDSNGGNFTTGPGIGIVDNNLFRVQSASPSWLGDTNVISGVWEWNTNAPSFSIDSSSSAKGLAVDTSTTFTYSGTGYSALPRTTAGYYTGTHPNAGWYQAESDTSAPGPISSLSPPNGATGVSSSADISWTSGSATTNFVVRFGTSSPGTLIGTQTALSYDPGALSASTQYFWRVDSQGPGGVTTGTVSSFTTAAAGGNPQSGKGNWRPNKTVLR